MSLERAGRADVGPRKGPQEGASSTARSMAARRLNRNHLANERRSLGRELDAIAPRASARGSAGEPRYDLVLAPNLPDNSERVGSIFSPTLKRAPSHSPPVARRPSPSSHSPSPSLSRRPGLIVIGSVYAPSLGASPLSSPLARSLALVWRPRKWRTRKLAALDPGYLDVIQRRGDRASLPALSKTGRPPVTIV